MNDLVGRYLPHETTALQSLSTVNPSGVDSQSTAHRMARKARYALYAATTLIALQFITPVMAADPDGDGIESSQDLDNDNDGILDEEEIACTAFGNVEWSHRTLVSGLISSVITSAEIDVDIDDSITVAADITFGTGFEQLLSVSEYLLSGSSSTTLVSAKLASEYIEVGIEVNTDTYLLGTQTASFPQF